MFVVEVSSSLVSRRNHRTFARVGVDAPHVPARVVGTRPRIASARRSFARSRARSRRNGTEEGVKATS